ncbi:hypothetical protein BST61_g8976 [Cercospora zeina]
MAGFTAINTSETAAPESAEQRLAKVPPSSPTRNGDADTVTAAVCEYLGLGPADHQTMHAIGGGPQKRAATSKKRPAANSGKRLSKRFKPSTEFDSGQRMHVFASQRKSETSQTATGRGRQSPVALADSECQTRQVSSADDESSFSSLVPPRHGLHKFMAFTPPITAMDALDSTSMRTSMGFGNSHDIMSRAMHMRQIIHPGKVQEPAERSSTTKPSPVLRSDIDPRVEAKEMRNPAPQLKTRMDRPGQQSSWKAKEDALNKMASRRPEELSTIAATNMNDVVAAQQSTSSGVESDTAFEVSTSVVPSKPLQRSSSTGDGQLTSDDELNDSFATELLPALDDEANRAKSRTRTRTPTARSYRQNMREVDEHETYDGALLSDAERLFLEQHISTSPERRAIVRQPFPRAILDRSPIAGASRATVLRTCFRLGEALNVGHQAVRTNSNVMIELYARIASFWNEKSSSRKQHFVFGDLFHGNAPRLEGTFERRGRATMWDKDCNVSLDPDASSTMCRVVGRMKRDAERKWCLEISGIWGASWEDVEWVAGIVNPPA